jgi:hypothetical protein
MKWVVIRWRVSGRHGAMRFTLPGLADLAVVGQLKNIRLIVARVAPGAIPYARCERALDTCAAPVFSDFPENESDIETAPASAGLD